MRTPSRHWSVSVDPVAPDQLESGATAVVGAHLEARREDEAVELVGHVVDDNARLGDAVHSAAAGVDQRDVVAVERLQILVVEAGALAEVAIPGLERRRGGAIGDDLIDSCPDLFHLGEIRELDVAGPLLGVHRPIRVMAHHGKLAGDARPGVGDQILLGLSAGREDLKVLDAFALPARL